MPRSGANSRETRHTRAHGVERSRHRAVEPAARRDRAGDDAADTPARPPRRLRRRRHLAQVAADLAVRQRRRGRMARQAAGAARPLHRRIARGPCGPRDGRCRRAGRPVRGLRPHRRGAARPRAARRHLRRLPCLAERHRPSGLAGDLRPAGARPPAGAGLRARPRQVRGRPARRRTWPSSPPRPAGRCLARPPNPIATG